MRYWLDADVFIRAHKGSYPVGIAKTFWRWMDRMVADGVLVSPKRCFDEVIKGRKKDDALFVWINRHKGAGLCLRPVAEVDEIATRIGDYVFIEPRYPTHQRLLFAKGGDAWLIAAAKHDGGVVVSNESAKFPDSKKVRIPDVCEVFEVRCITMEDLIREIPADF
jgi:Domain of unknown function (DUF4411)